LNIFIELFEQMLFQIQLILVRFITFPSFLFYIFSCIASLIRTRSARKDLSTTGHNENVLNNNAVMTSERTGTGKSRKIIRSQKTIATSSADMINTSGKLNLD